MRVAHKTAAITITNEDDARAFVAERCDAEAVARLERYAEQLRAENARQNLVAQSTLDHVWQRHIADSAQLLDLLDGDTSAPTPDQPWLDLGTGAGPPGLIIAAMCPEWAVTLVESRARRVEWLERVRDDLGLKRCNIIGERLERITPFPASVISARAFAPMDRLFSLSAAFSTAQTLWLLPKGQSAAQDLAKLPTRIQRMFHVEQSRTNPEAGIIVGKLSSKKAKARK